MCPLLDDSRRRIYRTDDRPSQLWHRAPSFTPFFSTSEKQFTMPMPKAIFSLNDHVYWLAFILVLVLVLFCGMSFDPGLRPLGNVKWSVWKRSMCHLVQEDTFMKFSDRIMDRVNNSEKVTTWELVHWLYKRKKSIKLLRLWCSPDHAQSSNSNERRNIERLFGATCKVFSSPFAKALSIGQFVNSMSKYTRCQFKGIIISLLT